MTSSDRRAIGEGAHAVGAHRQPDLVQQRLGRVGIELAIDVLDVRLEEGRVVARR